MDQEKKLTGYPSIDKPWLKYYSEESINASLPKDGAYSIIYRDNQDNLDRIAIEYYGKKITYKKFFEEVTAIADSLNYLGIKKGETVSICMLNSLETVYLMFAINKIGAISNLLCAMDSDKEIIAHINDTNSNYLFTLDIFSERIRNIIDDTGIISVFVANVTQSMPFITRMLARKLKKMQPLPLPNDKRFVSWKYFVSKKLSTSFICNDANAPAAICYTGGTTGGSKGVVMSNQCIIAVAQQYILRGIKLERNSRWIQILPLFIAYGVTCSLQIPMMVGMTVILRITGSEPISKLMKLKPQYILYGPAFWEKLADENKKIDFSDFKEGISGGDRLSEPVEEKINKYLTEHSCKNPLFNGYGMSEVGAAVSVNFEGAHELGSVGVPFVKTVISAFDIETGEELPVGREGEICIHTPSVMTEYLNNPQETANIIRRHADGKEWVHSGDLGYISSNGFVHISGRLKRYILVKCNQVYKKVFSLDIEKVLLKHPAVNNCAVVPMEHPDTEQAARAFIILKKETVLTEKLRTEIKEYCDTNLEPAYRPVRYEYVESYPLTKVGKIDYRALEETPESQNKGE